MRYFVELSYNGGRYCGWQRQRDAASVQETLERALSTLLREPVEVTGAGRTDTGVHAAYAVAHFDVAAPLTDPEHTAYKLNCLLPDDVAVFGVAPVADDAHARFSAAEREYRYFIESRKNPFTRRAAWHYYRPLDVERMDRAAASLLEYDDFTSFAKLNSNNKTNICRIVRAGWEESPEGVYRFTIRADRFLRNMVRALVGTLVDGGAGVTMWRSSARSSRAATCRARAAARRPKDFICGTSPTLPECSGAGNGRETCCLTKKYSELWERFSIWWVWSAPYWRCSTSSRKTFRPSAR